MRTLAEMAEKLKLYPPVESIYDPEVGYLAWHFTTGNNLEPLFIEVKEPGNGQGKELYRRMIRILTDRGTVPHHSVVAWRLTDNEVAGRFYASLGFSQMDLGFNAVYKDRGTTLMLTTWEALVAKLFPEGMK